MLANKLMGGSKDTLYVDDVFSTYLYTGNGSTQTINNGIDLAGEGGMVWTKNRGDATYNHSLIDTARGADKNLSTSVTDAQYTNTDRITSFSSSGFSIGSSAYHNASSNTYGSWTFRKAPKFFDVVTYTGNGATSKILNHALGITPGMIWVKRTDVASDWVVWTNTLAANTSLYLNTTAAAAAATLLNASSYGGSANSTTFYVHQSASGNDLNINGAQYVAYLFAHDTSADGIIQCGSFTTDGSGNATVTLGWEPQFIQYKASSGTSNWFNVDSMRGMTTSGTAGDAYLYPNLSNAESVSGVDNISPSATGFSVTAQAASTTYIYLAIRRPNKPPTSGSQVYNAIARTGTGAAATVTGVGFAPDLEAIAPRSATGGNNWVWFDRLRGGDRLLSSDNTGAEGSNTAVLLSDSLSTTMDGYRVQTANPINASAQTYIDYAFRRAPSFLDEVCYTGTGVARTVAHNLTVVPEMMIAKCRSAAALWLVYSSATGSNYYSVLNTTAAKAEDAAVWNNTTPTASVFSLGNAWVEANQSGQTYVAYLFASLPGISKVGSYTGNGTSQTIPCGFTTGARFILIKRTDAIGDWYVWDTVRGIVAANDPHLSLNTTAAEVTTDDSVDPDVSGFIVNQVAGIDINVSAATYIFLAIA